VLRKAQKGLVSAVHAANAYMGSGGMAPLILNLGTKWRSLDTLTPRPLEISKSKRLKIILSFKISFRIKFENYTSSTGGKTGRGVAWR